MRCVELSEFWYKLSSASYIHRCADILYVPRYINLCVSSSWCRLVSVLVRVHFWRTLSHPLKRACLSIWKTARARSPYVHMHQSLQGLIPGARKPLHSKSRSRVPGSLEIYFWRARAYQSCIFYVTCTRAYTGLFLAHATLSMQNTAHASTFTIPASRALRASSQIRSELHFRLVVVHF